MKTILYLDGNSLTIDNIITNIKSNSKIELTKYSWRKINTSYKYFNKVYNDDIPCYGLNTNLGSLIEFRIHKEIEFAFQNRIINSHAVGLGSRFSLEISKAIFLLRINCFAKGVSGVSPELVKLMLSLYNNNAIPEIFSTGSLGASGDLAPLSHLASFINCKGNGYLNDEYLSSEVIFKKLNIKPIKLKRKESLSIINGTSAMTAVAIFAVFSLKNLFKLMLVGMLMLMDSNNISHSFINPKAIDLKPHKGSIWIVNFLMSFILDIQNENINKSLQPVYSFRCVPYILSELHDSLIRVENTILIESNSANDNPLFIDKNSDPYHGGHFHGHVLSVVVDHLRISASHISGVIDRQLEHIMNPKNSCNISPFLSLDPTQGYCGFEGAQYLVTSLHINNVNLSSPYSIRTLPTNGGNQDYVSLGLQSSMSLLEITNNIKDIIAVYLASSVQCYSLQNRSPQKGIFKLIYDSINNIYKFPYKDDVLFNSIIEKIRADELFSKWFDEINHFDSRIKT